MQIKFVGGREVAIIRDITDPRYNRWAMGETKDVPDQDIDCLEAYGLPKRRNAIDAVLNAGIDWVDVSTGKNPLFTCHKCGERTESDFFRPGYETIDYADADGNRECVTCFLAAHPEHEKYHTDRGLPQGLLQIAIAKRAALDTAAPAPVRDIAAPIVAPPAPADHEESHE